MKKLKKKIKVIFFSWRTSSRKKKMNLKRKMMREKLENDKEIVDVDNEAEEYAEMIKRKKMKNFKFSSHFKYSFAKSWGCHHETVHFVGKTIFGIEIAQ